MTAGDPWGRYTEKQIKHALSLDSDALPPYVQSAAKRNAALKNQDPRRRLDDVISSFFLRPPHESKRLSANEAFESLNSIARACGRQW